MKQNNKKRNWIVTTFAPLSIYTGIHYPYALPQAKVFKNKHLSYCKNMNSIKFSKQIISLPIGEHLNISQIKHICYKIKKFFNA